MIDYRTRGTAKLGIACEALLVSAAFWMWLAALQGRWKLTGLDLQRYVVYNVVLVAGIVLAYTTATRKAWFSQLAFSAAHNKAVRQTVFSVGLLLLLLIGKQDKTISRIFLFTFLPILYVLLVLAHRTLPPVLQHLSFGGIRTQRVLVAGDGRNTVSLQSWLKSKERLGYSIAGMISHDGRGGAADGLKTLGTMENLEATIVEHDITQVILVEFPEFRSFVSFYKDVCERRGVRLLIVCDFERALNHPVTMFEDDGVRFIGLREEPLEDPFGRFGKRCLDIAIALVAMVFILPFTTLIVAFLQWRYSPGPIFFRQLRTGLQNLPFAIYKYRTMHVRNDDPSRQAIKGDARVFPGGEWLRKMSIDELPQFINVLVGDMSVVGPRPHLMEHDEVFARALANYPIRSSVKPGITGLAQVRGYRGETKTAKDVVRRVESDIYYLENWSFFMDCWIIIRTATQVILPPINSILAHAEALNSLARPLLRTSARGGLSAVHAKSAFNS